MDAAEVHDSDVQDRSEQERIAQRLAKYKSRETLSEDFLGKQKRGRPCTEARTAVIHGGILYDELSQE